MLFLKVELGKTEIHCRPITLSEQQKSFFGYAISFRQKVRLTLWAAY